MTRYVGQRLILMVGTLIGVLTVTFVLTHILPGSPVEVMLGHRPTADQVQAAKHELGLDLPLWRQYLRFLAEVGQGHFGKSFLTNQPVLQDIAQRLMATVELTTLAMICILAIGVPIGVLSAVKANSPIDHFVRSLSVAGVALPAFMLGMLLQMTFYGWLGWLPLQGRMASTVLLDHRFPAVTGLFLVDSLLAHDMTAFRDAAAHIVLPLATLT
ncbi:MAG TPA: ABC transporter permease, partial [Dongiaceae bacterium]|nr:ABC transporter permease [Dongiaceae bacterium]